MWIVDDMAQRLLLQSSDDSTNAVEDVSPTSTLNLRIASIFIIFAAGMLGATPPLFMKVRKESAVQSLGNLDCGGR